MDVTSLKNGARVSEIEIWEFFRDGCDGLLNIEARKPEGPFIDAD